MNWNGQRTTLNHLIRKLSDPSNAEKYTKDFADERWKRVQDSLATRPVYIPLSYTLLSAGQAPPFKATTPQLGYDVIIIGIKTDIWPARDIELKFTDSDTGLVRTGDDATIFLRSDDIAGCSVDAGGGQLGTFYLPEPIELKARQRLTVGVYKTDNNPAVDLNANIVLIGVRVYNQAQQALDSPEIDRINQVIATRSQPVTRILKIGFVYSGSAGGETDVNNLSPRVDEPLIIHGIRSTFRRSKINIGISGEALWTVIPDTTPIWGVAGEDELDNENYQWFPKGVYLRSGGTIEIPKLIQSIDGSTVEASLTGQIAFYCKTV